MRYSTRIQHRVASAGLLDTSVLIDFDLIDHDLLPQEMTISAITLAELSAGLHGSIDALERARRQDRLQRIEAYFRPVPFDGAAARAYGRIYSMVRATGRKPRGGRAVDLLIAATALSTGLALYTRNAADFAGLEDMLSIVALR